MYFPCSKKACWQGQQNLSNSTTIWERICKNKLPVVEPRQSTLFPMAIEVSSSNSEKFNCAFSGLSFLLRIYRWFLSLDQDYMKKLKDTCCSGAIFFAVCRGKVWVYPAFCA